jgi:hypothetical protein
LYENLLKLFYSLWLKYLGLRRVLRVRKCTICGQDKPIAREIEGKFLCEDCLITKSTISCPICNEPMLLPSFYDHLIGKHDKEEMARSMTHAKKRTLFGLS